MSSRLAKTNTGKARSRRLVLCPANAIFKIWKRLLKRNNSCVMLLKLTGKWNIYIFVSLCLAVFLLCLFPFEVSNGRFIFWPWVFVCNLSQDNRRFKSKQININHFAVQNGVKHTVQTFSRRSDSLLEEDDNYLRKSLTLPRTRKLSESNSSSVLSAYQR